MQNSIKVLFGLLLLISCSNNTEVKSEVKEENVPREVICISENGDTLATFTTYDNVHSFAVEGIIVVPGFKDIKTGKTVEIRTRTGTVIIQ